MMKDKRIRINKVMAAWSDGRRVNMAPSVEREVGSAKSALHYFYSGLREGDENLYGICAMVREECRCREVDADRLWEEGRHTEALNEMMYAAMEVLPDEGRGIEFEDVQWLSPEETFFWHPSVREYLRLMRRCEGYCRRDPRLWPLLEGERIYLDYRRYLRALGLWVHNA